MANRHNTNSVETLESIWQPSPSSQFFLSPKDWEADPQARVYGHQLRRAWDAREGLGLCAVLCVDGKPAVYFKRVDSKQLEQENEWQRRLWNQGTATMLVVQDSSEVRVYSALARPEKNPATSNEDVRLIDVFDYVASALELANFIRSVETGQFYRDYPSKFHSERAVDKYLLDNLGEARDQLCDPELDFALTPSTAHAFLGRCLFTCYLLERGIIGHSQLRRAGAKGEVAKARTLKDLLELLSATEATDVLYGLFRVLKDDFNGSMFGGRLVGEKPQIRKRHIDVLHRFLSGDEMKTHQGALFPLYDFRFIPIEFISAVYEDFLATEDETSEPNSGSNNKRRKAGAYYTPPRLAELVVDIATEGWDTLLGKRCLDPACGSGIFLVILFQRMAEEWRRRNPRARNTKRARALRELLTTSLCGVDVNETACMVACFSLYLAFMDQFDDPRDIWGLADELRKTGTEKVLPLLMAGTEDDEDIGEPNKPAIIVANFFGAELPELGQFDLTIGNPPWVGRNQAADQVLEQWILSEPCNGLTGNPFIKELSGCPGNKAGRRAWFLPNRQSANAFMWKAPLHTKEEGSVCLLVPSKVLLANQVDQFQIAWFGRFAVQAVWQLSDYRRILFEGAICPALIVKFQRRLPKSGDRITYIVPKVERITPKRGDISVLSDDRRSIRLSEILDGATRGRAFSTWKKHFWGTGRDQELIDRLLGLPKLAELAGPSGRNRWTKGVGFQPYHEGKSRGGWESAWWDKNHLYVQSRSDDVDLLLLKSDCEKVGSQFPKLRRNPEREIFTGPLVLFNRPCTRIAFSEFSVLFQDSFRAISGPSRDKALLLFLTAVLTSPLAKYFLFHTSANLGVERDTVLLDEYLEIPFPLPESTKTPSHSIAIINEVAELLQRAKRSLDSLQAGLYLGFDQQRKLITEDTKARLAKLVNDYYGLCDWERTLVDETVSIFEPSKTPGSLDSPIPTLQRAESADYRQYSKLLCSTLNGWLKRHSWKVSPTARIARRPGLGLLTLGRTDHAEEYVEQIAGEEFERTLLRIQKAVSRQQGSIAYARGFAMFEPQQFHVLKPLSLRHWTKTAALNDADALMGFMATAGG